MKHIESCTLKLWPRLWGGLSRVTTSAVAAEFRYVGRDLSTWPVRAVWSSTPPPTLLAFMDIVKLKRGVR